MNTLNNNSNTVSNNILTTVLIVGAGPAGIGAAICLEELGIKDYKIIDKGSIGESFKNWPKETKMAGNNCSR